MAGAVLLLSLCFLGPAFGFTPEVWKRQQGNVKGRMPACADFDRDAQRLRWTDGSYAETGQVGLGGGLEVSVPKAFCVEMLRVVEWLDTCEQLLHAVRRAARLWSDYHPAIYFNISDDVPPSQAEVVLRTDRTGKKPEALAWASLKEDGRFEIVFNTKRCFTAPLSLMPSDASGTSRFAERCERAAKSNFEVTLAHEFGHVLGIGHPGAKGFFMSPAALAVPSLQQYIPISSADVCSGLEVRHQGIDCTTIHEESECMKQPSCKIRLASAWCENALSDALMGANAKSSIDFTKPSENDLAALFFLYPSRDRRETWGTKPIPLMSMKPNKLKFMLEEHISIGKTTLPSDDLGSLSRHQLAQLVLRSRPWHNLTLQGLEDAPPSMSSSQGLEDAPPSVSSSSKDLPVVTLFILTVVLLAFIYVEEPIRSFASFSMNCIKSKWESNKKLKRKMKRKRKSLPSVLHLREDEEGEKEREEEEVWEDEDDEEAEKEKEEKTEEEEEVFAGLSRGFLLDRLNEDTHLPSVLYLREDEEGEEEREEEEVSEDEDDEEAEKEEEEKTEEEEEVFAGLSRGFLPDRLNEDTHLPAVLHLHEDEGEKEEKKQSVAEEEVDEEAKKEERADKHEA